MRLYLGPLRSWQPYLSGRRASRLSRKSGRQEATAHRPRALSDTQPPGCRSGTSGPERGWYSAAPSASHYAAAIAAMGPRRENDGSVASAMESDSVVLTARTMPLHSVHSAIPQARGPGHEFTHDRCSFHAVHPACDPGAFGCPGAGQHSVSTVEHHRSGFAWKVAYS